MISAASPEASHHRDLIVRGAAVSIVRRPSLRLHHRAEANGRRRLHQNPKQHRKRGAALIIDHYASRGFSTKDGLTSRPVSARSRLRRMRPVERKAGRFACLGHRTKYELSSISRLEDRCVRCRRAPTKVIEQGLLRLLITACGTSPAAQSSTGRWTVNSFAPPPLRGDSNCRRASQQRRGSLISLFGP